METCETCRYWAHEIIGDDKADYCVMVYRQKSLAVLQVNNDGLEYAGEDNYLLTMPDFGCNQHRPKAGQEEGKG